MSLVLCLHVLHNLFKLHGTGYGFVLFLQGIHFRGFSLPECQAKLPAAKEGGEPLPEGFLWLLLTGEVPTKEQVDTVTADLRSRSKVPGHVFDVINAFPVTAHPMTQLTAGVMALQVHIQNSLFSSIMFLLQLFRSFAWGL
jgi:citrate synthase